MDLWHNYFKISAGIVSNAATIYNSPRPGRNISDLPGDYYQIHEIIMENRRISVNSIAEQLET